MKFLMISKSVINTHTQIILMMEKFGQTIGSHGLEQAIQLGLDTLIKHILILNGKMVL